MPSPASPIPTVSTAQYTPRGPNSLTRIFHDHFPAFAQSYDSLYAKDYGRFRLERISRVAQRFERKRALLFAEYLDKQLLLELPHRQFVFSIPKALRIYFRHDQKLFASVSSLIFCLIRQFYRLAAGSPLLKTAAAVAFQPFGDFLRANAHWHAIVLEGGFDDDGRFLFLPIHDTQKLTEAFRRAVLKLLMSKALITEEFASTLLCWKNSGFSIDNQVRINGADHKTRSALAQYIARAPLSLAKLFYLPAEATVRYSSAFIHSPAGRPTYPLLRVVLLPQPLEVAPVQSYHPSRPTGLEGSPWGDR